MIVGEGFIQAQIRRLGTGDDRSGWLYFPSSVLFGVNSLDERGELDEGPLLVVVDECGADGAVVGDLRMNTGLEVVSVWL